MKIDEKNANFKKDVKTDPKNKLLHLVSKESTENGRSSDFKEN